MVNYFCLGPVLKMTSLFSNAMFALSISKRSILNRTSAGGSLVLTYIVDRCELFLDSSHICFLSFKEISARLTTNIGKAEGVWLYFQQVRTDFRIVWTILSAFFVSLISISCCTALRVTEGLYY